MRKREFRLARWGWLLLPLALLALAGGTGGTPAAAQAGMFPAFISMPGVSPRGVAVDKVGNVFVSASVGTGSSEHIKIWKFTPAGEPAFSVDTYIADIGQGTIGGLMVTADGDLYIALAAGAGRGVYRMDREGQIELLPGSNQIFFANGLAFDDVGTLFITESVSLNGQVPPSGPGSIWRIPRGGTAELCLRDDLLAGNRVLGNPVPIGANGIVYYHGNLYVTNTEKGTVLRVPIWPDGTLGALELWTTLQQVPEALPILSTYFPVVAPDGIALDVFGNLYVAVLTRCAVVRINLSNKSQETVAVFPPTLLDFPASLFFGTGMGERTNLFVTSLGMGKAAGFPFAGPALTKIDAGVPGRPLH